MQCPSCNGLRPANNAPCPLCNAPSPLVTEAWNGQGAPAAFGNQNQSAFAPPWGGSGALQNDWSGSGAQQMAFPSSQPNFSGSGMQQMSFPPSSQPNVGGSGAQPRAFPSGQQAFAPQPDGSDNSFWTQNRATREMRGSGSGQQQSLLPVPYQDPNRQALSVLPTAFPTLAPGIPQVNPLLPALPDADQEAPIYVAPMYTKPRPIIPRYRAISGLISVLIVFSLLCGGVGYYAQVTGRLAFFEKLFGNYAPPPIVSTQKTLPVPSNQVIRSTTPAAAVIDSVGISTSAPNGIIPALINQFTVGQPIYLVCGANTANQKAAGVITIKWYTDNHLYRVDPSNKPIGPNQSVAAIFRTIYGLPTEGKAEVYWNKDLAATVLFVVEPSAS